MSIKVGVSAMILRNNKVLMGKRKGSHGAGLYSFPGGKIELNESLIGGLKREIFEETNLILGDVIPLLVYNLTEFAPKHYVGIGFLATCNEGEAILNEPDKCEGWGWYDIDDLPLPYFPTIEHYKIAYKKYVYDGQKLMLFDS